MAGEENAETIPSQFVSVECQASLEDLPLSAHLCAAREELRYLRALACRVLDVQAALLWEAQAQAQATVGQSHWTASAAPGEESVVSPGSSRSKSTQTNPADRDRHCDVLEAERLVKVYERCSRMMVEAARRTCACCPASFADADGAADGTAEGDVESDMEGSANKADRPAPQPRGRWMRLLDRLFSRLSLFS